CHRLRGASTIGTVDVVYGEVARIHVRDDVVLPNGKLDIAKIRPIARMGYFDHAVIDSVFEMVIPDEQALAGLEGRALRESAISRSAACAASRSASAASNSPRRSPNSSCSYKAVRFAAASKRARAAWASSVAGEPVAHIPSRGGSCFRTL